MSDDNINILGYNEELAVVIFTLVGSSCSLIGASFIIWAYIKFEILRNFAFKLVFWLSISDFILCAGKIITLLEIENFSVEHWDRSKILCKAQSLLINYGGLASITCTVAIAWALYVSLIKAETYIEIRYKYRLLGFCFGLPFVLTLLPLLNGNYGSSGSWCWIAKSNHSLAWRMFEFYIPLWIAIIYNSYTYYKVIEFLKQTMQENIDQSMIRRFMMYPMILIICWFFASYNRIYTFFYKESMILNILHRLFGSLQGLLNAIIYGMTLNVRRVIKRYMKKNCMCKWIFKNKSNNEIKEDVLNNDNDESGTDTEENNHISPFERYHMEESRKKLIRMSTDDIELELRNIHRQKWKNHHLVQTSFVNYYQFFVQQLMLYVILYLFVSLCMCTRLEIFLLG